MIAMLPVSGSAMILSPSPDFPESTVTYVSVSQSGEKTAGVTFTVHDVYYDGHLLMYSVTTAPNEKGYTAYNDVLSDDQSSTRADIAAKTGSIPLGAYCEGIVYTEDGKEVGIDVGKFEFDTGRNEGSTYVRDFGFSFLPDEAPNELRVILTLGVMETPGQVIGDMELLELKIPLKTPAVKRVLPNRH
jgi:hypothetical protein